MAITPENIYEHELIGLDAEVIDCSDEKKIGISGEVIDESRDTLIIEGKHIVKENCRFLFQLPGGKEAEISGKDIQGRPEDRID